jgi:hypothetical protein
METKKNSNAVPKPSEVVKVKSPEKKKMKTLDKV